MGYRLEENNLKKLSKKINGITLIALIITIIVLLILAGVSIAMLTGQNGILTQAQNAKQITEIAKIKEEWDVEKLGLKMQEQKLKEINASGEEIKNYIKSIPDNLIGKISIGKGELAYDINQFTKEEQLTMKSDYGFKATGDNTAPYGSAEKKVKNGKVEITVFSADDESDIDKIILPDGTSKKIQYETENILLRGKFISAEGISEKLLKSYFKNVSLDENNQIMTVEDANGYNIILDLNGYGAPINYTFLNNCFKNGKNIISSGNDTTNKLMIIDESKKVEGMYEIKKTKENEITKFYDKTTGNDSIRQIKFNTKVNTWAVATINGITTEALGEYVSEIGNRWIHKHLGYSTNELFYRNAIYRVAGSRSATYNVDKNGTYTFTIVDLAGNETKIEVEVTEL